MYTNEGIERPLRKITEQKSEEDWKEQKIEEDCQVDIGHAEQGVEQQLQRDPRMNTAIPTQAEIIAAPKEIKDGKAPRVENIILEIKLGYGLEK